MGWGDWNFDPDEHGAKQTPESQVEIQCFYVHQTAKALCVNKTGDEADDDVWLPKDQIAFERKGVKITLWAPEKLLLDKGLI